MPPCATRVKAGAASALSGVGVVPETGSALQMSLQRHVARRTEQRRLRPHTHGAAAWRALESHRLAIDLHPRLAARGVALHFKQADAAQRRRVLLCAPRLPLLPLLLIAQKRHAAAAGEQALDALSHLGRELFAGAVLVTLAAFRVASAVFSRGNSAVGPRPESVCNTILRLEWPGARTFPWSLDPSCNWISARCGHKLRPAEMDVPA